MQFRTADLEKMKRIENDLARLLDGHAATTEAAIAAFACIRCAERLLSFYPAGTQTELRRVCADKIEGRMSPRDDPAANLLIMK